MRAVVTAGGTSEPIDDVRVITNLSSGRFGAAIGNALARRGVDVTLCAGRSLAAQPSWTAPGVRVAPFGGIGELDAAIDAALAAGPVDLLFMAAAVSDYAPVRTDGKIRSDLDELTVVLRRNPKLLPTLRQRCGPDAFLVGFKLLSGVSADELVATARRQIRDARLDLCVANDLRELGGAHHPVWLVTPDGGAIRCAGTKDQVAEALVDLALTRRQAHRYVSVSVAGPAPRHDPAHAAAIALVAAARAANLRPSTASHRAGPHRTGPHRTGPHGTGPHGAGSALWVTAADAEGDADALTYAEVARDTVAWRGERAPGPDAGVHGALYAAIPRLAAVVSTREPIGLPTATVDAAWPAGSIELGRAIGAALAAAGWDGRWDGGAFSVRLADHGWVLGLTDAGTSHGTSHGTRPGTSHGTTPEAFATRWAADRDAFRADLAAAGVDPALASCRPVVDRGAPIGVAGRFDADGIQAWSVWLAPDARGAGRGDALVEALVADRRHVVVLDGPLRDGYAERGFREVARRGAVSVLEPPNLRTDLAPAASVCLVARGPDGERRVLIGRRRTAPFDGYWAFPGGRCEPGEAPLACAVRELREETGIDLVDPRPIATRTVAVGGERGFSVTNFVIPVLNPPEPTRSAELDPKWLPLAEARALRPTAAGTRRILRALGDAP
ncbi:MAG: phosphopantothenoylcysteine decarboxylase [Myxococcota bacterium]